MSVVVVFSALGTRRRKGFACCGWGRGSNGAVSINSDSTELGGGTSSPSSGDVSRRDGDPASNRFASLEVENSTHVTAAEKRRPINWRELLGIWRVCAMGGERLRGKVLLVETDNM